MTSKSLFIIGDMSHKPSAQSIDIHHYAKRVEQALANLSKSQVYPEDRKQIIGFSERLKAEGISNGRLAKYVFHLTSIARIALALGFRLQEADRKSVESLLAKIEAIGYSENTKHDYKVVLKRFYQWLRGCDRDAKEYPPEVKWVKTGIPRSRKKLPEDILTQEEVI